MAPKISVIIPLYGTFDSERVYISIDSLKNQKNVNLEISVVEQSDSPRFLGLDGIIYIHIKPVFSSDGFLIPGLVRNIAVKNSDGDFIYNNDGDIIFRNQNYLCNLLKLMEESENICLCHPFMRRLPIENFENFRDRFKK